MIIKPCDNFFITFKKRAIWGAFFLSLLFLLSGCAVTKNVGISSCASISGMTNQTTVPELYGAMSKCVASADFKEASKHLLLARSYGEFDAKRVQDVTAHNAPLNIEHLYFNNLSFTERKKLQDELNRIYSKRDNIQKYCSVLKNAGYPHYYPRYMIDYGINPVSGSGLMEAFNALEFWDSLIAQTCLASQSKSALINVKKVKKKVLLNKNSLSVVDKISDVVWLSGNKKIAVLSGVKALGKNIQVFDESGSLGWRSQWRFSAPMVSDLDGNYIAATVTKFVGSNQISTVEVLNAATGNVLFKVHLPQEYLSSIELKGGRYQLRVHDMFFDVDSKNIGILFNYYSFTGGGYKNYVCIYDTDSGDIKHSFETKKVIKNMVFSQDVNSVIGVGGVVNRNLWNKGLAEEDWDSKEGTVYIRNWNYSIFKIDMDSGEFETIKDNIHSPFLKEAKFNVKQNLLATTSALGKMTYQVVKGAWREVVNQDPIRLWGYNGQLIKEFPISDPIGSVDISSDGRFLVSCAVSGKSNPVKIWDIATGELLQVLKYGFWSKGGLKPICIFSEDSKELAIGIASSVDIYHVDM